MYDNEDDEVQESSLILVSNKALLLSIVPLLGIAMVSHKMGLAVESPIVVGIIRTLVQLTVLGAILAPIFNYGHDRWWVVVIYVLFMVTLAALEASARSTYYFRGMFAGVFIAFAVNTALACLFAFGVLLRPTPVWEPQYVIPITGMLLGNCINGVSLSLNTALSSLVEQSNEVELLLAFGATPEEASARLFRESIRIGAMPLLNSMAVIGLISIPGMMTGQILGGTPPFEAAKYQMLILYLIAMAAFGTILSEIWMVKTVGFDAKSHMLCVDNFLKRPNTLNFLQSIRKLGAKFVELVHGVKPAPLAHIGESMTLLPGNAETSMQPSMESASKISLEFFPLGRKETDGQNDDKPSLPALEAKNITKSFVAKETNEDDRSASSSCESRSSSRTLFESLSLKIEAGDMLALVGPSGSGKTQLLRILARLTAPDDGSGQLYFRGQSQHTFSSPEQWRRDVRYVSQYKVDIPGTPSQFVGQLCRLHSWANKGSPKLGFMTSRIQQLLRHWGMEGVLFDSDWKSLSGGEAQRMYLAIAIASRPRVLLLDEVSSALDQKSKECVERTLHELTADGSTSILWVTHDSDQIRRMGPPESFEVID